MAASKYGNSAAGSGMYDVASASGRSRLVRSSVTPRKLSARKWSGIGALR